MSYPSDESSLKNRRYVTLILRLGIDQDAEQFDGELVDTIGSHSRRFKNREGLNKAVEAWFKETAQLFGASSEAGTADSKRKYG